MLRRLATHGDVSRETKTWQRERDALARAVNAARKDLHTTRVNAAIHRALTRWQQKFKERQ